ncbi:MAG: flippase-like domain-containing protein [Lachnospiraceae bacterium]|nr:flippase-like domain-containing protein [Lachnospiraceae bacterium]
MNKKKNWIWSFVAVVLAALSIWTVVQQTRDYSLDDFNNYISGADPAWIGIAIICMAAYILFEGLALLSVLKAFGYKRSVNKGIIYSAADIYFSAITPSATGGQPASAFFMLSDGVPAAVSAVALLLNLVMYTASIMTIGIIAIIIRPELFINFSTLSTVLIAIGYLILGILMTLIILLINREDWAHAIGLFFIKLLGKIKFIRNTKRFEHKLEKITAEYRECAEMIDGHRGMLVKCFVFNFLQRALQMCVSVALFIAGGGAITKAADVWATHAFSVIGSSVIPVPGAMGVIDYLLVDGMKNLMPADQAVSLELASRGISFYICVIVCILIVGFGYFSLNRRIKLLKSEDDD